MMETQEYKEIRRTTRELRKPLPATRTLTALMENLSMKVTAGEGAVLKNGRDGR
jgi:hypothetical protein